MAKKQIVAYFMHENEENTANDVLSNVTRTDSFLLGSIDEVDIPQLVAAGLIIQEVDDTPPEPLDEFVASTRGVSTPRAAFERAEDRSPGETDFFTVQLAGPLIEEWRLALQDQGAEVLEATGPNRFTLRLAPGTFGTVAGLGFVRQLRPYTADSAAPELIAPLDTGTGVTRDFSEMLTFDLRVHREEDVPAVLAWLQTNNVAVAGSSRRKIRVHLFRDAPELNQLKRLPEVALVEEYITPVLSNDRAREIIGLDQPDGVGAVVQTGQGQIVAVADTGLDDQHPDFQGRISGLIALGRQNDPTDPNGHGTHVAGSVLGDGAASNGEIRGTAPDADLFFQSIMDAQGRLGGLPLDLNDLFQEAFQAGARVHNNSWGADVEARYTFSSIEVDEFVESHPDMTIVIAAGNDGSDSEHINTDAGHVDWLSVGAPATSKNALTVGASRSDRTQGGLSTLTWGQAWPNDFPDGPIGDENISGDPESMAAFSSRGPCDDRRIKPDLVAPGTDILSAKSSRAPLANFWGAFSGHQSRYAFMGGTSMAAPLVAGCAALVREYYQGTRQHAPSAALVKATLINGARWLTGNDATAEFDKEPNFHQGFGRVHMPWTIPNPGEPNLELRFIDSWDDASQQFFRTGERFRYIVRANAGRALRACITWTDVPARALQNNVNLFVEHVPTGQKWIGNAELPGKLRLPDAENNIEVVRIDTPADGDYLVQVSAGNLLRTDGQAFALVVTGNLTSDLTPF
ncbi:S8 family serine peptidase [Anderseniella sp. Alg231-50]|uniref:S8 family serine peptidase n=1 Tax=Anderseniella sp. Alg231-50 TaxID=1922226 RepID=UPI00307BC86D